MKNTYRVSCDITRASAPLLWVRASKGMGFPAAEIIRLNSPVLFRGYEDIRQSYGH